MEVLLTTGGERTSLIVDDFFSGKESCPGTKSVQTPNIGFYLIYIHIYVFVSKNFCSMYKFLYNVIYKFMSMFIRDRIDT